MTAGDEPEVASPEEAAAGLAREIYWVGGARSTAPAAPAPIRDRLEEYGRQRRVDQRKYIPDDETLLASPSAWKRALKTRIWRASRFSTMRYDRLLAELADLNGELAARLASTEREVARIREELRRGRDEGP